MTTKSKPRLKLVKALRPRTMDIHSVFYLGREVVKRNRAFHANTAVLRCVDHMQLNHYEATVAEVYDQRTGELHAVITRAVGGDKVTILYKRPVKEGM